MGKLKIEPELIVRAKFKEYTDTLPTEEDVKEFVREMVRSVEKELQRRIDELEALYQAIVDKATSITVAAPSFSISAVCADPMAPVASTAVIASTVASVKVLKAEITNITGQFTQLTGQITSLGLPLPAPVTALESLISSATSALNIIPI